LNTSQVQVIVKLGGGAITEKEAKRPTPKTNVIERLAKEVASTGLSTIIVHGGGSFGHPLAEKYQIAEGFHAHRQLQGITETHRSMVALNNIVMDAIHEAKSDASTISPSSCFVTDAGRIKSAFIEPIVTALKLGCTPILFGDVVFDRTLGFTILSGDQIATYLAQELGARRLVFALESEGVFTKDPRKKGARLIEKLSLNQLVRLVGKVESGTKGSDVTGGMRKKLYESIPAVKAGINVCFAGVSQAGNLRSAIKGTAFTGTLIKGSRKS
jgi:isopentenyl phosphate kinase